MGGFRRLLGMVAVGAVVAAISSGVALADETPETRIARAVVEDRLDPEVASGLDAGPVQAIVALGGPGSSPGPGFPSLKARALARAGRDALVVTDYASFGSQLVEFRSKDALARYLESPGVRTVRVNHEVAASLGQSLPLINQPAAAASGYRGAGTAVVVIDTGVNYLQAAFGCTGLASPASCSVVSAQDFAPEDGLLDEIGHGTNVAATVVGVAPAAKIIGLDVFVGALSTDAWILAAIDWVVLNRATYNIRAVNLSVAYARTYRTSTCTGSNYDAAFAALRAAGVIPVVSSGNDGTRFGVYQDGVSIPACAPGALAVGAVYDSAMPDSTWGGGTTTCTDTGITADKIACFSQSGAPLGILAPGAVIVAGGFVLAGTSQAAPHVAGAVAVLASAAPGLAAAAIDGALRNAGPPLLDARSGITRNRLDLCAALAVVGKACGTVRGGATPPPGPVACNGLASHPVPALSALGSAYISTADGPVDLLLLGDEFVPCSSVLMDGSPRPVRYLAPGTLVVTLRASDVAEPGTHLVQVLNPAPGGGASLTLTLTVMGRAPVELAPVPPWALPPLQPRH